MKLITRQMKANEVAVRWFHAYANKDYWKQGSYSIGNGLTKEETYYELLSLGENPKPDDVDRVIGNDSWTECLCSECGKSAESVIQVGQKSSYDSAMICFHCLKRATRLVASVKGFEK